ncbi:GumC family protein [Thalassotalea euphylliae]|uniref:non-specific protein-tyrosine kinase n=1 Tax=Thalassotalea euphylliae TaxID=1655234 RepID=A0A3E0U5W2_9GAMM|nr:polysaccharide biosynthesis tyrosine autokinase [Thalassotalea euphylliae]REL31953.1 chain-length determining protein [Thalassotalea euphylliae]
MSEIQVHEHSSADQDIQYYLRILTRYRWRIFSLAFVLTLLATVLTFTIVPTYKATATLLVEAEKANVVSIEEVYGIDSGRQEYFFTQFEILKSRRIAQRVVEKLKLATHQEFIVDEDDDFSPVSVVKQLLAVNVGKQQSYTVDELHQKTMRAVVDEYMSRLSIAPVRNTQLVKISFEAASPKLSALIVNTHAEVYIESHLESQLMMTERASTWLNERLAVLKQKLDDSEDNLLAYQNQEELVDIDGVKSIEARELQELNQQLSVARQKLQQSENIFNLIQRNQGSLDSLIALPDVLNHALIIKVSEAVQNSKTKISELKGVYGPKHPIMIAAQLELSSAEDNLASQVSLLVSGISNEYKKLSVDVQNLEIAIKDKGTHYRELSRLDSRQQELKREVASNQQLYDAFFTRFKETKEVGEFESANARIIDPAIAPIVPYSPKKKVIVGVTFIMSILLGMGLAFVYEYLNDGIRSVEDIEQQLKQRMLGLLPKQKKLKSDVLPLRHYFDKEQHAFSESIRTLRTSLLLTNIDNNVKVVSVTSSVPGEGKTTVSINLAFALGQLEKVLLIDADMRRPSVAKRFDLPAYQEGLSNVLSGTHRLEECVVSDEESGIDVLTAGTLTTTPQELLASQALADFIKKAREQYDRIVIDTAPTQAVSDAIIITQQADSLIYVVKAESTRQRVIKQGLSRLGAMAGRIDGIVLNQVDLDKAAKYGEYHGYYDQYGYNTEQAQKAS